MELLRNGLNVAERCFGVRTGEAIGSVSYKETVDIEWSSGSSSQM